MEILRVREKIYQKFSSPSVAIGNFDGVHLGHREILSRTVKSAHDRGKEAVVYTFDPHPRIVLNKVQDVPRINTQEEREQILEELGIDVLILAEFTPEYASRLSSSSKTHSSRNSGSAACLWARTTVSARDAAELPPC